VKHGVCNSVTNLIGHMKFAVHKAFSFIAFFMFLWFHFLSLYVRLYVLYSFVGRFHPFIGHKGPYVEWSYSSTLFLTSALEGCEGSESRPCHTLPSGKTRYPLYRRLGGPQGRSGQVRKISPPPGFDPQTVQHVGSRYTDYATRPTV
jgi:hypothetical protein